VFNGVLDQGFMFYSDEAWFTLSSYVNSQNNRYWSTENLHTFHEAPLRGLKVEVWCAKSARRIIGPLCFHETIISEPFARLNLCLFFYELSDEEKSYGHFMQDNASANTVNNSVFALDEIFGERIISR
jgi:hypothetical protein